MYKFAKIFESNGRQVLATKGETEEGDPKLSVIFHFDGGEQIDVGLCFEQHQWGDLDKAFEDIGQSHVDSITAKVTPGMTPFEYLTMNKE